MKSSAPIVSLRKVHFAYPGDSFGRPPLFSDFDIDIRPGERLTVLGASGVGKSTLGRMLAGMLSPTKGRRETIVSSASGIVYVDQDPLHSVFPWQSVTRNLTYPLERLGWSSAERADRVHRLLALFRLASLAREFPRSLSGGELQRLAIARAVSWRPELLILDEAFAGLDLVTRGAVFNALEELATESHIAVVVITHNISDALRLGDRSIVLGARPLQILADLRCGSDADSPTEREGLESAIMEAIHAGHL